jgi:ferredoxin
MDPAIFPPALQAFAEQMLQHSRLQSQQNENISAILGVLQQQVQAAPPPPATVSAPSAPSAVPRYLSRPPDFDGKDADVCETFLAQCRQYIDACPATVFPTDDTKIDFVMSHLKGSAFDWVKPYLADRHNKTAASPIFDNFSAFCDALLDNKGDPDRINTATAKLQALRQKGSTSQYATDFFQLSAPLGWNNQALKAQFLLGLRADVKDQLALRDEVPDEIKDLATVAIRLDNRLFARKKENQSSSRAGAFRAPTGYPTTPVARVPSASFSVSAPRAAPPAVASGPVPMDIDGTVRRFKPLTPQERQQRIANNLCLYCGNPGHRVNACPAKTPARPVRPSRVQATTTTAPETTTSLN